MMRPPGWLSVRHDDRVHLPGLVTVRHSLVLGNSLSSP